MHRKTDIRSAPQRQSHLSERPFERLKAKSPATCQILWLTFQPGTCSAALSTCGCEADGSQTQLWEGILTVSFIAANNETGERRSWTCEYRLCFPPITPFISPTKKTLCCYVFNRKMERTTESMQVSEMEGKKTLLLFLIWNHFVG